MAIIFFRIYKYGTNTGLFRLKRDPKNTGGIHPFPLSIPFPYFFINTETGGINIEIRTGRDGIFSVRFHPYPSWSTGAWLGFMHPTKQPLKLQPLTKPKLENGPFLSRYCFPLPGRRCTDRCTDRAVHPRGTRSRHPD